MSPDRLRSESMDPRAAQRRRRTVLCAGGAMTAAAILLGLGLVFSGGAPTLARGAAPCGPAAFEPAPFRANPPFLAPAPRRPQISPPF